jgi:phosphotriesterase-related protein
VTAASQTIVRTVRGDIDPAELGPTDAHEHLFLETPLQPRDTFQDVDLAIAEAATLVTAGVHALVDWTPLGLGRRADGLVAVSEATGLHVVAATGLHRDAHYEADAWARTATVVMLEERFIDELTRGMDGTGARAGVIKVGASYHHVSALEATAFESAAAAHAATGAPVCVHTQHGTMGEGLVERLRNLGVQPSAVILAHLDRNPDAGEHTAIAETGAWLQYDGPGRTKYWPDSTILALIADVAERGHGDRLLVGGDVGRANMMRAYGGGPGMDYVFARFRPRLARELGGDLARAIFEDNPARAFAFVPRHDEGSAA